MTISPRSMTTVTGLEGAVDTWIYITALSMPSRMERILSHFQEWFRCMKRMQCTFISITMVREWRKGGGTMPVTMAVAIFMTSLLHHW